MAITKILARKGRLDVGIRYVLNGDKTQEQILTAHQGCDPGRELRQMMETKAQYQDVLKQVPAEFAQPAAAVLELL